MYTYSLWQAYVSKVCALIGQGRGDAFGVAEGLFLGVPPPHPHAI